jgi:hypothetical protein
MPEYYVCNKGDEHSGWMDGCILWWCPQGHGYTYDLNSAGVFTDANKAKDYPPQDYCTYVPKAVVDAASRSPRLAWWNEIHIGSAARTTQNPTENEAAQLAVCERAADAPAAGKAA